MSIIHIMYNVCCTNPFSCYTCMYMYMYIIVTYIYMYMYMYIHVHRLCMCMYYVFPHLSWLQESNGLSGISTRTGVVIN